MKYQLRTAKNYQLPCPLVRSCKDPSDYFYMNDLNNKKRNRIWQLMQKTRPALYNMIQTDDFIQALFRACTVIGTDEEGREYIKSSPQIVIEKVKK